MIHTGPWFSKLELKFMGSLWELGNIPTSRFPQAKWVFLQETELESGQLARKVEGRLHFSSSTSWAGALTRARKDTFIPGSPGPYPMHRTSLDVKKLDKVVNFILRDFYCNKNRSINDA